MKIKILLKTQNFSDSLMFNHIEHLKFIDGYVFKYQNKYEINYEYIKKISNNTFNYTKLYKKLHDIKLIELSDIIFNDNHEDNIKDKDNINDKENKKDNNKGDNKDNNNENFSKELNDVLDMFKNILIQANINRPLNIRINTNDNLSDLACVITINPNEYQVYVSNNFSKLDIDEQKFILGHEIGHIEQFSTSNFIYKANKLSLYLKRNFVNIFILSIASSFVIGSLNIKTPTKWLSVAGIMFSNVLLKIVNCKFSHCLEYDADEKACKYLKSTAGANSFFGNRNFVGGFLHSHPLNYNRIHNLSKLQF